MKKNKKDAEIVTFYSYNGEVGRSMMAANSAIILAESGYKVLLIDFDFNAPALHYYLKDLLHDPNLSETLGLIDYLDDFIDESLNVCNPDPDWFRKFFTLENYLQKIKINDSIIDFVGAGLQHLYYSQKVNRFNWQLFYEKYQGGLLFEELKKTIKKEYDFVIIDSQSGIGDVSAISILQMADKVIGFINKKNADDFVKVIISICTKKSKETDGFTLYPVFSMNKNPDLSEKLKTTLGVPVDERFWSVNFIEYDSFFAYAEVLANKQPSRKIERQYKDILSQVTRCNLN